MGRYTIRVGWKHDAPVQTTDPDWGWARTFEAAIKKAEKLTRRIRSDCRVGIEHEGRIIAQSGTQGVFTGDTRKLTPEA